MFCIANFMNLVSTCYWCCFRILFGFISCYVYIFILPSIWIRLLPIWEPLIYSSRYLYPHQQANNTSINKVRTILYNTAYCFYIKSQLLLRRQINLHCTPWRTVFQRFCGQIIGIQPYLSILPHFKIKKLPSSLYVSDRNLSCLYIYSGTTSFITRAIAYCQNMAHSFTAISFNTDALAIFL